MTNLKVITDNDGNPIFTNCVTLEGRQNAEYDIHVMEDGRLLKNDDGSYLIGTKIRLSRMDDGMIKADILMLLNESQYSFIYDPALFAVYTDDAYGFIFRYIGTETDGDKIMIPNGLEDCTYMFYGSDIISAPKIPESVLITSFMFADCRHLSDAENAVLSKNVLVADLMFDGCISLTKGVDVPSNVKLCRYMYSESGITLPVRIGYGVEDCSGMYEGCEHLRIKPMIPVTAKEASVGVTDGCVLLM